MFGYISKVFICVSLIINLNRWIDSKFKNTYYARYFTVMALLLSIENVLGFICNQIPFYNIIKIIFTAYISVPGNDMPLYIMRKYVQSYYTKFDKLHEEFIKFIISFSIHIKDTIAKYTQIINQLREIKEKLDSSNDNSKLEKIFIN
ncbi:hypothetical protein A0H76_325 [Hepatospora eriocheir]|uniref:Protein YOP1 n=1 Tax=Hepatospora eriocheir TaxID=1081669 RepID=A0A1X0QIX3_9MICR|nr:hypothetical protein HERIO_1434 [Hepatospora eriocheir]ORD99712.1 hypothetical protein A0H76_325 [Hepatospora eriocheir]